MYVYIVTDDDNNVIYVGVTRDIERRMMEHRSELIDGFTKYYHLHKLVYCEEFSGKNDAIRREKQLKGWRREKKNALIETLNPKWEELMPYTDTSDPTTSP